MGVRILLKELFAEHWVLAERLLYWLGRILVLFFQIYLKLVVSRLDGIVSFLIVELCAELGFVNILDGLCLLLLLGLFVGLALRVFAFVWMFGSFLRFGVVNLIIRGHFWPSAVLRVNIVLNIRVLDRTHFWVFPSKRSILLRSPKGVLNRDLLRQVLGSNVELWGIPPQRSIKLAMRLAWSVLFEHEHLLLQLKHLLLKLLVDLVVCDQLDHWYVLVVL